MPTQAWVGLKAEGQVCCTKLIKKKQLTLLSKERDCPGVFWHGWLEMAPQHLETLAKISIQTTLSIIHVPVPACSSVFLLMH